MSAKSANRLIVTNEEKIRQTVEPKIKGDS